MRKINVGSKVKIIGSTTAGEFKYFHRKGIVAAKLPQYVKGKERYLVSFGEYVHEYEGKNLK